MPRFDFCETKIWRVPTSFQANYGDFQEIYAFGGTAFIRRSLFRYFGKFIGFPLCQSHCALAIKKEIFESTQLTASAGVSFNKFLAKIASGEQKPDGITLIGPEKAPLFIDNLPIEKFFGVGKVTAEKMKKLGIHKGKDLRAWEEAALQKAFGKSGVHFYKMVHLNDFRPVVPDRIRKSIGEERTFEKNIESYGLIMMKLNEMAKHLEKYMKDRNIKGKTITVKIKVCQIFNKKPEAPLWLSLPIREVR
jgi:nucleotidyltransferase/DNA polymerase involved in DNA repair